jgi:hypothetical protein
VRDVDNILYFPRGIEVKITPRSEVTDEFRQKIRNSFRDYTAGTAEDYQGQDKLAFIDLIREQNFQVDPDVIINEYIRETLEREGVVELADLANLEEISNLMDEAVQ